MANRYIKSPYEVVAVSDVVKVWVLTVDRERHRVSLTMIQPGSERKAPERKPAAPREQQARQGDRRGGDRPPSRGRRPAGPPQGQGQGQGRSGPPRPGGRPGNPPRHGG